MKYNVACFWCLYLLLCRVNLSLLCNKSYVSFIMSFKEVVYPRHRRDYAIFTAMGVLFFKTLYTLVLKVTKFGRITFLWEGMGLQLSVPHTSRITMFWVCYVVFGAMCSPKHYYSV